ncbi:MAG: YvcK family protein [Dehalococcoidia bacterium]|nr:YvcK family protein [Dehalococcoidia bacterium]
MSRQSIMKWLYVGLGVKRWLLLLALGVAVMGLGFAYLLREAYVSYTFPSWVYWATLQFVPRWLRGVLFVSLASGISIYAVWRLNRSLISVLLPADRQDALVDRIYSARTQQRGPKIVAIGGGTGLSTLLRGLKSYTVNLTAVVTVADDGGSSGRLRRDLDVIPPGDLRNCIAALSDAEPLVTKLFQYRFDEHTGEGGSGVGGHSFGNLFIVAMAGVTGNMEEAIRETSRVLAVRGAIVPSTLANVTLAAKLENGTTVHGESQIPLAGSPVRELMIEPGNVRSNPEAVRALIEADLIVVGPGSLYTSVLPNLLVRELGEALRISRAYKLYVSNVATQHGETDGYDAADHYATLRRHLRGTDFAHVVLANSNLPSEPLPAEWRSQPVVAPGDADYGHARLVLADLVDQEVRYRHHSERLASAVMRLYFERDLRARAREQVPALAP